MLLKRGDKSSDVNRAQSLLVNYGLDIKIDGDFGMRTEAAARVFQRELSLYRDGVIGNKTWEKLQLYQSTTKPLRPVLNWFQPTSYFSQRDNLYYSSSTCNVTSLAMILTYWGIQPGIIMPINNSFVSPVQLEDELFLRLQEPDALAYYILNFPDLYEQGYPDNQVHGMLGWLAQQYGCKWKYSEKTTPESITKFSKPMMTSGKFTASGHIIVIIGETTSGDFIINDPAGDWNTSYQVRDGKYRIYDRESAWQVMAGVNPGRRIHQVSK